MSTGAPVKPSAQGQAPAFFVPGQPQQAQAEATTQGKATLDGQPQLEYLPGSSSLVQPVSYQTHPSAAGHAGSSFVEAAAAGPSPQGPQYPAWSYDHAVLPAANQGPASPVWPLQPQEPHALDAHGTPLHDSLHAHAHAHAVHAAFNSVGGDLQEVEL